MSERATPPPPDEGDPPPSTARAADRWRTVIRVAPAVLVALMIVIGLCYSLIDRWRRGSASFAAAAGLAAAFRLVLPDRAAGVLAVRSKPFDVSFLLGIAAILGTAAIWEINTGQ